LDRRSFLQAAFGSSVAFLAEPLSASGPWAFLTNSTAPQSLATDLMPSFFAAYERTLDLSSMPERIGILAREFFLPNARVFTAAGFNGGSHGRFYDSRIANWLEQIDPIADDVRALAARAPLEWAEHEVGFSAAFRDYVPSMAYFLISLFSFDGYIAELDGTPALFLGLDAIAANSEVSNNLKVLFDHEAFHLYDVAGRTVNSPPLVWSRVWAEGLATYVSAKLNPDASLQQVFLGFDPSALATEELAWAAGEVLDHLDDPISDVTSWLFDARLTESGRSPRLAYFLGFSAAQSAGSTTDLATLARLPDGSARAILAATLETLAGRSQARARSSGVAR
jgi:hypothetical protein